MLDINYIRQNIDLVKKAIEDKKIDLDLDQLLKIDEKRREYITKIDDLRHQKREAAQKRDNEQGKKIKQQLEKIEEDFKVVEKDFNSLLLRVPTPASPDTPIGESEKDNKVVEEVGEIPKFDFEIKDHIELGKLLEIIDFERGVKVAGYRGYFLKNEGAILALALMMYTFRKVSEKGYTPMIPPTLVKEFALFGSGYFKGLDYDPEIDEIYQIATEDKEASGKASKEKKFLVGTAEPSLLAYYCGEVLKKEDLPIKFSGFSQCYRSEIGSYGRDTKGLYRVHEFMKVELVTILPADIELSNKIHDEMIDLSKELHQDLGIPYRKLFICMGDLSAGKYKQYDSETYLPGSGRWAETGSASNFLDWQARNLDVKYQEADVKKHVFMINNTAFPTPRILMAIMENFQQADGSVRVPKVLIPYTGFSEIKVKK